MPSIPPESSAHPSSARASARGASAQSSTAQSSTGSSSSSSEALEGLARVRRPEVFTWLDGDGETYDCSCDMWSVGVNDCSCDMWSVGVTAYVLLCGKLPYDFPDENNLAVHVKTAPRLCALNQMTHSHLKQYTKQHMDF